ncbi:MAG: efflux transporter outer membrane subunit [Formivibrio sp.]|nr:efflux transporter outer membrane subunit [Formivibrio sp.]
MHFSKNRFMGCLSIMLLGLAGCAQIPADQDALAQQDVTRIELAANIKLAQSGWPKAQWWTGYADEQLNRLIAQALNKGPSLQVAAVRIASARAALKLDSADQGVNVSLDAASNRQRYSANGLYPPPIGGGYFTESTLQAKASYDFDWWGKHRSAIAAAVGEVNARQAEYAQAEQTLAAAVAQSYFNLQAGWARLANLQKIRTAQRDLVTDKIKRIAHGLASIDEQRNAEAELANINRQYAALEAQCGRELEALRALLGADNHALVELAPHALPAMPPALPANLGIELLARRPDLQAARWRVEASLSKIDVVQAAFYPDINLTGMIGLDSLSLDTLLSAPSRTLFIGPALTLPLFDSGRLQARLGVARTQRNEMIADYNQSVFVAVREVAQAGITVQGLEIQTREQAAAAAATYALLRSTEARFRQGVADRSTLLAAQLAAFEQEDASLQLKNQQLLSDVALIKALGGGYRAGQTAQTSALKH